jgi:preprotein translocase subunit SecA
VFKIYTIQEIRIPYIISALKASALYFNNVHYIVQNGRIVIVDEFTGRIMPDRRWGDGLHQAIEEKLQIRQKTETVAAITYQNSYFILNCLG